MSRTRSRSPAAAGPCRPRSGRRPPGPGGGSCRWPGPAPGRRRRTRRRVRPRAPPAAPPRPGRRRPAHGARAARPLGHLLREGGEGLRTHSPPSPPSRRGRVRRRTGRPGGAAVRCSACRGRRPRRARRGREVAALEDGVARAAQQGRALLEERRVVAPPRVEGADDLGVRNVVRPVDAQGVGGAPQPGDGPVGGERQGAQDAGAGVGHETGGGHPGEERDLRVPGLGGERGAVGEAVRLRRARRSPARGRRARCRPGPAPVRRAAVRCPGAGRGVPRRCPRRSAAGRPRSRALARLRTRARRTSVATATPSPSRSIRHSAAGRVSPGRRLAAPSERTVGWRGIRSSGK